MENYDELIKQAVEGTETVLLTYKESIASDAEQNKDEENWF
jgi:hypothetical protein